MKFIQDDEYILLMEDRYGGRYGLDDLKRLRDVGIQTIVRYPFWNEIETHLGEYVWDTIDEYIELTRQADMKCLFALYEGVPDYFPPEWYLKTPDGSIYIGVYQERVISPWNLDGWEYNLDFLNKFCNRISTKDVMCFRATMRGAEAMLPQYGQYRLDGLYWETMRRMLIEEQSIFYASHDSHELWTCFHHAFDGSGTSGTERARDLYREMAGEFPDAKHYCISYTQFRNDVIGEDKNLADMQELGLNMFGGSEYAEGIIANTDTAIQQGFRGFISAPLHWWSGHKSLEPWMVETIRDSLAKWREARAYSG